MEYVFILAGGRGERLWPISRKERPKQLVKIFSEKTLVEETLNRLTDYVPKDRIFIICNPTLAEQIEAEIEGVEKSNLIIEPQGRNSAPAIFLAAAYVEKLDPDPTMIILPSDHYIESTEDFQKTLKEASQLAEKTKGLVTLGIKPTYPETGYGYIIMDKNNKVKNFTEKPDEITAKKYVDSKKALWNSGMFIWKAKALVDAMYEHQLKQYETFRRLRWFSSEALCNGQTGEIFKNFEATSIDYSIMEKAENVYCVQARFNWNDVGTWASLDSLFEKDKNSNINIGRTLQVDSKNNILFSKDHLIAAVGIENLVVVSSKNLTLVCTKEKAQAVRKIVAQLSDNEELNEYL